jgi:hypothetical protein
VIDTTRDNVSQATKATKGMGQSAIDTTKGMVSPREWVSRPWTRPRELVSPREWVSRPWTRPREWVSACVVMWHGFDHWCLGTNSV